MQQSMTHRSVNDAGNCGDCNSPLLMQLLIAAAGSLPHECNAQLGFREHMIQSKAAFFWFELILQQFKHI